MDDLLGMMQAGIHAQTDGPAAILSLIYPQIEEMEVARAVGILAYLL
jgi:hypothetical protein